MADASPAARGSFRSDSPVPGDGGNVWNRYIKSATKSVASLALGIAIDRGLIRSVNEPIFSFFPELSDLRSPEKDRIQLVHALTMTMGLKWVEAIPSNEDDNDEVRMHMASDPCRYVLGLPATAPAGQEYFYNTGALTLVSAIVRKATGRPLDEFARETLFQPLGITIVEWVRVKGDSDAGGGLRLRPRVPKVGHERKLLVIGQVENHNRLNIAAALADANTRTCMSSFRAYRRAAGGIINGRPRDRLPPIMARGY